MFSLSRSLSLLIFVKKILLDIVSFIYLFFFLLVLEIFRKKKLVIYSNCDIE